LQTDDGLPIDAGIISNITTVGLLRCVRYESSFVLSATTPKFKTPVPLFVGAFCMEAMAPDSTSEMWGIPEAYFFDHTYMKRVLSSVKSDDCNRAPDFVLSEALKGDWCNGVLCAENSLAHQVEQGDFAKLDPQRGLRTRWGEDVNLLWAGTATVSYHIIWR
jgi:hypothetical protein